MNRRIDDEKNPNPILRPEIIYMIWERTGCDQLFISMSLLDKCVNQYFSKVPAVQIRKCAHRIQKHIGLHRTFGNPEHDDTEAYEYMHTTLAFPTWMIESNVISIDGPYSNIVKNILSKVRENSWDSLWDLIGVSDRRPYFISGGSIAQIAVGDTWESDVDIFMSTMNGKEQQGRKKVGIYDLVMRDIDEPQNVLRRFDISICQIGVLVDPNRSLAVYATPLFLCSLIYRLLVVQVSDLTMSYEIPHVIINGNPLNTTIDDRFCKHIVMGHHEDFVSCIPCRSVVDYTVENDRYTRWIKRVEKYRSRFPDWHLSYHFAPKLETTNDNDDGSKQIKRLKIN